MFAQNQSSICQDFNRDIRVLSLKKTHFQFFFIFSPCKLKTVIQRVFKIFSILFLLHGKLLLPPYHYMWFNIPVCCYDSKLCYSLFIYHSVFYLFYVFWVIFLSFHDHRKHCEKVHFQPNFQSERQPDSIRGLFICHFVRLFVCSS